MRRPFLILIALFLLIAGVAFAVVLFFQKEEAPAVPGPVTFPTGGMQESLGTREPRMVIAGREGTSFSIPDLTKDPGTAPEPYVATQYILAEYCLSEEGCTNAEAGEGFRVVYEERDQSFDVLLLAEPLRETRAKAEQYLALKLELTPAQLCSLNISVGTINAINGFYAGEELGLSVCPGAVQLP